MTDHIYKKIEVVGTSTNSIDDAIRNAVHKAAETVRHLRWFEVTDLRGDIADGDVSHFQVTVKLGFRLQESE